jgi:heat-inducible transcriptional repressor
VLQRRAVSEFFASAHAALEELLHETSQLLSTVSQHAAMVVGPQHDAAIVRSVQLVPLQPNVVLVVTVLSNGAVEKSVMTLDHDVDDARVGAATAVLDRSFKGATWTDLPNLSATGDADVDALAGAALDALAGRASAEPEHFFVGGASRLAAEGSAFETSERASRLLEMLEHQVVVVSLVRELLEQGLSVSIGSENPLDELRDCSIVLAPYAVDGVPLGVVGVLGPTRMDYRHALAAVSAVSQQLGRHLS